ncbi:MAG: hypothetical protein ACE365_02850 [Gammaproteobacteria bacterium]
MLQNNNRNHIKCCGIIVSVIAFYGILYLPGYLFAYFGRYKPSQEDYDSVSAAWNEVCHEATGRGIHKLEEHECNAQLFRHKPSSPLCENYFNITQAGSKETLNCYDPCVAFCDAFFNLCEKNCFDAIALSFLIFFWVCCAPCLGALAYSLSPCVSSLFGYYLEGFRRGAGLIYPILDDCMGGLIRKLDFIISALICFCNALYTTCDFLGKLPEMIQEVGFFCAREEHNIQSGNVINLDDVELRPMEIGSECV